MARKKKPKVVPRPPQEIALEEKVASVADPLFVLNITTGKRPRELRTTLHPIPDWAVSPLRKRILEAAADIMKQNRVIKYRSEVASEARVKKRIENAIKREDRLIKKRESLYQQMIEKFMALPEADKEKVRRAQQEALDEKEHDKNVENWQNELSKEMRELIAEIVPNKKIYVKKGPPVLTAERKEQIKLQVIDQVIKKRAGGV